MKNAEPPKPACDRRRRGQSLVEFTMVTPFLLSLMTGMVWFGFAMHNYMILTNGVNTGAQLLGMSRGITTDPCSTASTAIQSATPSLTSASLSYTFTINGNSFSGTSCTGAAADMVQGATAQVAVTYPCTLAVYALPASACSLGSESAQVIQ